jgi:hypothetical protein
MDIEFKHVGVRPSHNRLYDGMKFQERDIRAYQHPPPDCRPGAIQGDVELEGFHGLVCFAEYGGVCFVGLLLSDVVQYFSLFNTIEHVEKLNIESGNRVRKYHSTMSMELDAHFPLLTIRSKP